MVASGLRRGRARSGAAGLPPAHHRFTGAGRAPPRPRAAAQGLAAEADPGPPGGESGKRPCGRLSWREPMPRLPRLVKLTPVCSLPESSSTKAMDGEREPSIACAAL